VTVVVASVKEGKESTMHNSHSNEICV